MMLLLPPALYKSPADRDVALAKSGTTLGTATGFAQKGQVRAFEPPHSTNYLLREFVHVVGRKHAAKLRIICRY